MACSAAHCECRYVRLTCAECGKGYLVDAYDIVTGAAKLVNGTEGEKIVAGYLLTGSACTKCIPAKVDRLLGKVAA